MSEVKQMGKLDIYNVSEAKGMWIIGSLSSAGVSFATAPALQRTHAAAIREAERLAALHPGKMFMPVQLQGAAIKHAVTWI